MSGDILLIGVGNDLRGDDALGLLVARSFARRNLSGISVVENRGDGAALMQLWHNDSHVVLVDAIASQSPPGRIHRIDARRESLSAILPRSTHAFGVLHAVETARALECLPLSFFIHGIEGGTYEYGAGLSAPVAESMSSLLSNVESDLRLALGEDIHERGIGT
jgi:hydrogenase maturation protease